MKHPSPFRPLWATFACLFASSAAPADVIEVPVTIRDFQMSHIDFENGIGFDPGFVDEVIGADGKPVYIGGDGTATTHGEKFFNQWYNDVPGVNLSTQFTIPLDNEMSEPGGVYVFSDEEFFPIDDELFGNEGLPHNYHFTLEMHSSFPYGPGLFITVTGDDDIFLFIDGQLVVDLGGVHEAKSMTVDLDTLPLTPGEVYDIDLFYAERHTGRAELAIVTNLQFLFEPTVPVVTINEIRIDQPGENLDEYFELISDPGAPLAGLHYLVIGDDESETNSGVVEAAIDLDGLATGSDGLFLAVEDTFTLTDPGEADLVLSEDGLNFENDDNVTHLLVADFTGAVGDDLDTDDDGVLDVTPWSSVLDAVGLVKEPDPPIDTEYVYGAALGFEDIGPDGETVPGHVFRCAPLDTWTIGLFDASDPKAADTPGEENADCVAPVECPEDIDEDGSVGFTDLLAVLSAWGPCEGCAEDVDGDDSVGFTDLLAVLSGWGPCPAP